MRRYIVSFTFILISCLSLQVNAQSYPNRVIKLVVPFPPGGLIDNAARLIGPELSKELGQPVVIENKPGAGGNLAAADVAKASPDGYTLLLGTTGTFVTNPLLYAKLPYSNQSFVPIVNAVNATTLRFAPPLTVSDAEIDEAVAMVKEVLK